ELHPAPPRVGRAAKAEPGVLDERPDRLPRVALRPHADHPDAGDPAALGAPGGPLAAARVLAPRGRGAAARAAVAPRRAPGAVGGSGATGGPGTARTRASAASGARSRRAGGTPPRSWPGPGAPSTRARRSESRLP